jgi:hypothetical protein
MPRPCGTESLFIFARQREGPSIRAAFGAALCARFALRAVSCALLLLSGGGALSFARADRIDLPAASPADAFRATAAEGSQTRQGAYEVWTLRGDCVLQQGNRTARGDAAVLWIDHSDPQQPGVTKVIAYLEGGVRVSSQRTAELQRLPPTHPGNPPAGPSNQGSQLTDRTWLGRFHTAATASVRPIRTADEDEAAAAGRPYLAATNEALRRRGRAARHQELSELKSGTAPAAPQTTAVNYEQLISGTAGTALPRPANATTGGVQPAQFIPLVPPQVNGTSSGPAGGPVGGRRVRVFPRTSTGIQAETFPSPDGRERIAVIDSGVNIIIEGVGEFGKLDISTDRVVLWTSAVSLPDLSGQSSQAADTPLELYLEGNIIFRQGDRVIYANRMYYNVPGKYGAVLDAEMLTPAPEYQGLLRLKADVLQQVNDSQFVATGAALTSSRLGVPRYWFQSNRLDVTDIQRPLTDFRGAPAIDPVTGDQAMDHELLAVSRGNSVYAFGTPFFYWPTIAVDLADPTFYVNSFSYRNDRIFGNRVNVGWNMYQLLGMKPIRGTKWGLSTDYLSDRGPALGTDFRYNRDSFFGIPGPTVGEVDAWGIYDTGLDNIGADRIGLTPETEYRGHIHFRHQQFFANGWQVKATADAISDRNFMEQYFEWAWDQRDFPAAGIEVKRTIDNTSFSVLADARINDFFTQTGHYPRLQYTMLGQPLLYDRLTWNSQTFAEYADLRTADTNYPQVGSPLIWERPNDAAVAAYDQREGLRAATRHEIAAPLELGPVKVTPYVLGEIAYWGQDRAGNEMTRLYGQTGIRGSLPVWRVDPTVKSRLLNLDGIAHKITFEAEGLYADADQNFTDLPLYDPLNDDPLEAFERRFYLPTSGLNPAFLSPTTFRFDPRFYALRSGLQSNVTSPSTEIADDLELVNFAVRQRWQTKRGLPGRQRIIDWITFDIGGSFYPDADRDNFGADFGMLFYDFRWNIGDRLTILSDAYADTFADGLQTVSVGSVLTRPGQGSLYAGYRSLSGPVTTDIVSAAVTYRMSEKWVGAASASMDLGNNGNISQSLRFVRIGESLLVSLGVTYDQGLDNVGFMFSLQPRFLPRNNLSDVAGIAIPPAGAFGLE